MGFMGMALDSAGNVWTWGADYNFYPPYLMAQGRGDAPYNWALTPTKVNVGGHRVIDIASNGQTCFALTNQTFGNGQLYGWAFQAGSIGVGAAGNTVVGSPDAGGAGLAPWLLDSAYRNSIPTGRQIRKIYSGSLTNYFILDDSTLYAQGDNSNGGVGDGNMLDWLHYVGASGSSPYNWDQAYGELLYRKPHQVAIGKHNFTSVFTGPALVYYAIFEDANGILFGCGRNKGAVLPNNVGPVDSVGGEVQSNYPNSWNVADLTTLWPFRPVPYIIRTTSPYFQFVSGVPFQAQYPLNTSGVAPVASAGSNQSISITSATLRGSATFSTPAKGIIQRKWTFSGPNSPIAPLTADDTISISGLVNGTYTASYKVTDNNFKTNTSTMTITVSSSGAIIPTVDAGTNQNITLPISSVTLSGTATGNGGATITSTTWSLSSGPNVPVIVSVGSLTTGVTGLIQGTYVFQLSATDSNGNSNNTTVIVTVNAALPPGIGGSLLLRRANRIFWN